MPYARDFMQVILIANPIAYLFVGLNNLMRATGYPKKAMLSSFLTVAVNVIVAAYIHFCLGLGNPRCGYGDGHSAIDRFGLGFGAFLE